MPESFVPIDVVAEHFTVSTSTIRSWVRSGRIPKNAYIKVGNTYRFSLNAVVEELLQVKEPEIPEDPLEGLINESSKLNTDDDM
jgi:excisionase family DNA binding protein|tara:strand:- start:804 stop:1055 length:252 start_codon:yes stop_codon:yes gene_type:complete